MENFRTSGLGVIPKHEGGWHIIYHLSAPDGLIISINDFINPFTYSLTCCSLDDAYTIINKLSPRALPSKIDLKDAFCLIPVQSSNWNLLGIFWKQNFYVDTSLPSGLGTAFYPFNCLSTTLHWILEENYGADHLLHYLDNFFTAGPAESSTCEEKLHVMLALCAKLNVPIKPSKVEGPTTSLTFLGIHFNTTSMEASFTSERKQALLHELSSLHARKKVQNKNCYP